ncbi:hypothetical protein AB1399_08365 [Hydrogenibacillus schlegelii]|uniref:Uncharacterized protein n=2 Tax=Hydrogenibacillus schlegelii TaxID=1484 RepID=A0A179IMN4_HYDSH|nr:hypothetical protein [Hydrogenibacillus schlegelii]MBT9281286.1 hypothetical protein [Hydrogenibacillus schlegelii]OAR03513.1 hypothetical protein SA87_02385 [Hydrogenibacillus schlegelii]PTQ54308.1 MAG: hypothetical protein HSCHL_0587 [Hydrogenibacillus schlegelii]
MWERAWTADIRRRLMGEGAPGRLRSSAARAGASAVLRPAPEELGRWLARRHALTYGMPAPASRVQAGRWIDGWVAALRAAAPAVATGTAPGAAYAHQLGQALLYYLHDSGYAARAARRAGHRAAVLSPFAPEAVAAEAEGGEAPYVADWPEAEVGDALGWTALHFPPEEAEAYAAAFLEAYRRAFALPEDAGPFLYARMAYPAGWLEALGAPQAPEQAARLAAAFRQEKKRTAAVARIRRLLASIGLSAPAIDWLERGLEAVG